MPNASQQPTPGVTLVVAAGLCLIGSSPAHAFDNAFFPTQSSGNRGVDVQAIQHLLNQHGDAVDPIGVFGIRAAAPGHVRLIFFNDPAGTASGSTRTASTPAGAINPIHKADK